MPSPTRQTIKPGIYKHYKGQMYEVIDCAHHTETEEEYVVYRALYEPYQLWLRPVSMFCENILIDGITTPRFQLIRPFGS